MNLSPSESDCCIKVHDSGSCIIGHTNLPSSLAFINVRISAECNGTEVNITTHPTNTSLDQLFESVNLTCLATGRPSPEYRWLRNNVSIDGATLPHYSIPRADPNDRGFYTCRVNNSRGTSISDGALVSIRGN